MVIENELMWADDGSNWKGIKSRLKKGLIWSFVRVDPCGWLWWITSLRIVSELINMPRRELTNSHICYRPGMWALEIVSISLFFPPWIAFSCEGALPNSLSAWSSFVSWAYELPEHCFRKALRIVGALVISGAYNYCLVPTLTPHFLNSCGPVSDFPHLLLHWRFRKCYCGAFCKEGDEY